MSANRAQPRPNASLVGAFRPVGGLRPSAVRCPWARNLRVLPPVSSRTRHGIVNRERADEKGADVRILVAYASEHGSTREIAERLADRLRRSGVAVVLADAGGVDSVQEFDAVVLGSAVHNGQWLPAAAELADHCARASTVPMVWPFSVGTVGAHGSALGPRASRFVRSRQPIPDAVVTCLGESRHRWFSGVMRPEDVSALGRTLFRLIGGRFGDHRDWPDVLAWADDLVARLTSGTGREELVDEGQQAQALTGDV